MNPKALLIKKSYHLTKYKLALERNDAEEAERQIKYYKAIVNELNK
jgi:hypothetical protein